MDARIFLAGAGFLLLAASLVAGKRAGWAAVAGGAALVGLAAWESDPLLVLGAFALVAVRFVRPPQKDSPGQSTPGMERLAAPAASSGKRP